MDRPWSTQVLLGALCLLTISKHSLGIETLSPNQTLADGEVLTSPGQVFELGFFSRSTSRSKFLGIWYKATPDIIAWVANRNNPILGSQGILTLLKNGTLVISTEEGRIIWSSNSSRAASSPVLQFLETGNLVVLEKLTVSQESCIWQSFDYPGDTRLPGMKTVHDPDTGESKYLTSWKSVDDPSTGEFSYRIENDGLSQMVVMEERRKRYRNVFWNGHFIGFPIVPDQGWKAEVVLKGGRLVALVHPFNDSFSTRLIMNSSGSLQRYMMNEQKDGWILMVATPRDSCDSYGWCGHNGICKIDKAPECECLRGFKPKHEKEWRSLDWTSGCNRNLPLDCQKEDGFLKVEGIKFPDSLNVQLKTSMSMVECHDECLKNCNCTAYADPDYNNEARCLMWFGDLIDTREQTGEAGDASSIYIRVPLFDLATIAAATKKFSGDNVIGEGGFGPADQHMSALLTWPKRFDIIMGIVRGLLYLHHDSRLKIIHRDLRKIFNVNPYRRVVSNFSLINPLLRKTVIEDSSALRVCFGLLK